MGRVRIAARSALSAAVVLAGLGVTGSVASSADDRPTLSIQVPPGALVLAGGSGRVTTFLNPAADGSVILAVDGIATADPQSVTRDGPSATWDLPALSSGPHRLAATFTPTDPTRASLIAPTAQIDVAEEGLQLGFHGRTRDPLVVGAPLACPDGTQHVVAQVDARTPLELGSPSPTPQWHLPSVDDLALGRGRHDVSIACMAPGGSPSAAWHAGLYVTAVGGPGWWEAVDLAPRTPRVRLSVVRRGTSAVVTAEVSPPSAGLLTIHDGSGNLAAPLSTSEKRAKVTVRSRSLLRGHHELVATFGPTDLDHVVSAASAPVDVGTGTERLTLPSQGSLSAPIPVGSTRACDPGDRSASLSVASVDAGWKKTRVATLRDLRRGRPLALSSVSLPQVARDAHLTVTAGRYDLTLACAGGRLFSAHLWVTDPEVDRGWWEAIAAPSATSANALLEGGTSGGTVDVSVSPPVAGRVDVLDGTARVAGRSFTDAAARGSLPVAIPAHAADRPLTIVFRPADRSRLVASRSAVQVTSADPALPQGLVPTAEVSQPASEDPSPDGVLALTTSFTPGQPLDLGDLTLNGSGNALEGSTRLTGITVSDGRSTQEPWTLSIGATDLRGRDGQAISSAGLALRDVSVTHGCSGCETHLAEGGSLAISGMGDADVSGDLSLSAPSSTPPGDYRGTITITVV